MRRLCFSRSTAQCVQQNKAIVCQAPMWVHEKPIICRPPPPFPSETHKQKRNSQVWFSHNVTFWYSPPPRFVYCCVNSFRRDDEWLLSFLLGVNGKWDAACLIEIFILGLNISNLQRFPLLRCIFNHEKMPVRMPSQFFFLSVLQKSTHTNKYKAKERKFATQLHVQANLTPPPPTPCSPSPSTLMLQC